MYTCMLWIPIAKLPSEKLTSMFMSPSIEYWEYLFTTPVIKITKPRHFIVKESSKCSVFVPISWEIVNIYMYWPFVLCISKWFYSNSMRIACASCCITKRNQWYYQVAHILIQGLVVLMWNIYWVMTLLRYLRHENIRHLKILK